MIGASREISVQRILRMEPQEPEVKQPDGHRKRGCFAQASVAALIVLLFLLLRSCREYRYDPAEYAACPDGYLQDGDQCYPDAN